jgi:hypothetical protein
MANRERISPIFSSRADEPALAEAIDAFVIGLAERIDHLQDAEREAGLVRLAAFAGDLAADAEALGYEALARIAHVVESAAGEEKSDEAHANLVKLTEIAYRVRMGHRGAL